MNLVPYFLRSAIFFVAVWVIASLIPVALKQWHMGDGCPALGARSRLLRRSCSLCSDGVGRRPRAAANAMAVHDRMAPSVPVGGQRVDA